MPPRKRKPLGKELDELEKKDPYVQAAARSFEATKKKILDGRSHPMPCTDKRCRWHNADN